MGEMIDGDFPVIIRDRDDLTAWLCERSDRHSCLPPEILRAVASAIEKAPGCPAYGGDWSPYLVPVSPADVWVDKIVRMCMTFLDALRDDA